MTSHAPARVGSRWPIWLAGIGLVLLTGLVYSNQFSAPLVFDGYPWIYINEKIKSVWPIWTPSMGMMRPIPYLSFSLNYWAGEWDVRGWHVVNRVIHAIAALALFGLVRRTLSRDPCAKHYGGHATVLAWAITAIWLAHPLQTQSVIYLYQRLESMAGMFFLLSLYSFARSIDSPRPLFWRTLAVVWSVLCMGTKELAVALPVLTLWYDWALVARNWREVASRWKFHLAMFATLGVLATLMACNLNKYVQGGIGDGARVTPLDYALNQPNVVLHYLKLSVYPIGQNLDYGWRVSHDWRELAPGIVVLGCMALATLVAMWREPGWGFVGGWFFVILAPTSSIVPIADLAFEHRMYLPLASLAVVLVLGVYNLIRAAGEWANSDTWLVRHCWLLLMLCVITTLAALAWRRNQEYETAVRIWTDVVAKSPHHDRAHYNLGCAFYAERRWPEAIECYRETLHLNPRYDAAVISLADSLFQLHDNQQALAELEKFIIHNPDNDTVLDYFDRYVIQHEGRSAAIERYERIMQARPELAENPRLLVRSGSHLSAAGKRELAILVFEQALGLDPNFAAAHSALAAELFARTQYAAAARHYRRALETVPNDPALHHVLGRTLENLGDRNGAIASYQEALRLRPGFTEAQASLDAILKTPATN